MNRKSLFLIMILILLGSVFAQQNPDHEECVQRGFDVIGERGLFEECLNGNYSNYNECSKIYNQSGRNIFCRFNDGNICLLDSFNDGSCGSEYMSDEYCVEEGVYVWDEGNCCEGLHPYPLANIGHPKCMNVSLKERVIDYMIISPTLTFGLLGLFFVLVIGFVVKRVFFKNKL